MQKKLNQYKGSLTSSQIANGINAASSNAKRLLEDAIILFDKGCYPSAVSLAILSIEESGKEPILRGLALSADEKQSKNYWREYRSHTKKNVTWLLPQLVKQGASRLDDFRTLFEKTSNHPYLLDQIKQIGIYSDCLGKAHWSIPEEVIDEELANNIIMVAKILSSSKREITELEIDLWKKHLGPVWGISKDSGDRALENWYAEMQENGLVPEGKNKMEIFIRKGLW